MNDLAFGEVPISRLSTQIRMKRLALQLMRSCGAFALARTMSATMARILMYHNFCGPNESRLDAVSASALRIQLEYLRRHFHIVPLSQILDHLQFGRRLDRRAVALTIDDGRRNFYNFFFPLLKEFQVPATFFVVSSFIRREDWVWTDKVLWLSEQPSRTTELCPGGIDAFFGLLNKMPPQARNAHIEIVAAKMGISIPKQAPCKYAPCSWSELREMADSGLVEIGSHTVSHPILSTMTDAESWKELTLSRAEIQEGLGKKVNSFCFPNGTGDDYRPSQVRLIKEAGYASAVLTSPGMVSRSTNPYELPRIAVGGWSNALQFSKYVDGAEYYQTKLRESFRMLPNMRRGGPWETVPTTAQN